MYLLAGASSVIAIETAKKLQLVGYSVTGFSTKEQLFSYDYFHTIPAYTEDAFPKIDGPVNGLVYFPGTINLKPFHRISEADFLSDFQINCLGAVTFIKSYLPNLKLAPNASVVLISSVAAQTGMPFHASVSMAKSAIEGLTRSLAAELAPGIRVNCIAPSLTATPLSEKLINTAERLEALKNRNPLKKIGSPTELASVITFLLSPEASWITGQVIAVDGGMGALRL